MPSSPRAGRRAPRLSCLTIGLPLANSMASINIASKMLRTGTLLDIMLPDCGLVLCYERRECVKGIVVLVFVALSC